jgi:hypothetical protein
MAGVYGLSFFFPLNANECQFLLWLAYTELFPVNHSMLKCNNLRSAVDHVWSNAIGFEKSLYNIKEG